MFGKQIILCFLIGLLLATKVKAQCIIADTTQYLRDSFELRKADFAGKPFSYFIDKLKLTPKNFLIYFPLRHRPNVFYIDRVFLDLNSFMKIIENDLQHKKNRSFEIIFATPIAIPIAYIEKGGVLDLGTEWDAGKANFFATNIIQAMNVRGI